MNPNHQLTEPVFYFAMAFAFCLGFFSAAAWYSKKQKAAGGTAASK
ncbi:MAG TPA: hypothetical protein VKR32_17105 [Puia sp.]|nr:hypothetical protein [Puia sp.]